MGTLTKALSSETRLEMMRILSREALHITGLANRLGISVPVAARHVEILEKAGLVQRRRYGRTHILEARSEGLLAFMDELCESLEVEVEEGSSVLDALKLTSAVEVKRGREGSLLVSLDGEKGYYIYEVDGILPKKPLDAYLIHRDSVVKLKQLLPVARKVISIRVRKTRRRPIRGGERIPMGEAEEKGRLEG
ncbi:MAG: helix-turn-helix domain-containing protein [Candidatus Bathyarchaeia archaeon]